ncbi:MAG TPA: DNRLRE domain-containing protein [Chthoniobacter sp.]|nr:DNRLRE domain-containing protein [Chthoniobacter sp.]
MPLTRFRSAFLLALASTGLCTSVWATTVDFTPVADTAIFSPYPDNNFGTSTLETGTNGVGAAGRGLVRFDLSSIPVGAIITGVQLTMTVVRVPPGDQHAGPIDSDFNVFRMLVPWTEGTGGGNSGSIAQVGETTWNERGAGGVAAWGTPGGQIGTDFAENASTSAAVGSTVGPLLWGSTPQFVADVQFWLDNPAQNFGFMTISDQEGAPGTARRMASRESAGGSSSPPTLTVTYSLVPEPGAGMLTVIGALGWSCRRFRARQGDGR